MKNLIGIDIGGTKVSVVLGGTRKAETTTGNPHFQYEYFVTGKSVFNTPTGDPQRTIHLISEIVNQLLSQHGLGIEMVHAAGICCGGPLDSNKGVIMSPPNLPGWDDFHIADILEQTIGIRPLLQNDANACAIAEWKWGAARGMTNFVFLTFGTGMGAGLVLNGKLYIGSNDMAGEIGHIRLENAGPVGYGKSGSFEGFCSGGGIAQLAGSMALEQIQMGRHVSWCKDKSMVQSLTAKIIGDQAASGDPLACEVFRISGSYLGKGLSYLIDILNPEAIIIGGIFIHQKDLLLPAAMEVINKETLALSAKRCRILPAELGNQIGDAAALGVAAYSMEV
jgi:glucokinase